MFFLWGEDFLEVHFFYHLSSKMFERNREFWVDEGVVLSLRTKVVKEFGAQASIFLIFQKIVNFVFVILL